MSRPNLKDKVKDKAAAIETRKFACEQAEKRLGRLAYETHHAVKSGNAETVHDLRVALRRFSQVLRAFKSFFRGKQVRKIRREVKRTMGLAGEVRNCDIALKLLSKVKRGETADFRTKLQSRRREAQRSLVPALKQWMGRKSSRKWREILAAAAAETAQTSGNQTLALAAREILPRMTERFFERGNRAARVKASPAELHQFRIAAKKFRYSLELFAPLYGPSLNPALNKIKHAQGLLGDINDCETVRAMISQHKGADAVMAWLRKRQRQRIGAFQRYWVATLGAQAEMQSWSDFLSHSVGKSRAARKPAARTGAAGPLSSTPAVA